MACSKCDNPLTPKEFKYSISHYGIALCRECQEDYEPLKKKFEKQKNRSTPEAIKLHGILVKLGVNAKLEQYDRFKHIDIAIPDADLNLEIDGMQHSYSEKQALADLKRTYYSLKKGYITLRIPNKLIQENAYETAKYLKKLIEENEDQIDDEDLF